MAYNVVDEIKAIYGLKNDYERADKELNQKKTQKVDYMKNWIKSNVEVPSENLKVDYSKPLSDSEIKPLEAKKTSAADKAKALYNRLVENGYSGYAEKLKQMNTEQARSYVNEIAAKAGGKQAIRPYMYNLGQKYGLSKNQIDNLISYDNATQEVTFGGKLVGLANDNNINGTTYWDTNVLDDAFNSYVDRAGLKTDTMKYNEGNDAIQTKLAQDWEEQLKGSNAINDRYGNHMDTAYGNVLESDIAKAVLANMGVQGLKAYDSELYSGAAANSGNVDSFAAANARREQLNKNAIGNLLAYNIGKQERDAYLDGLNDWQSLQDSQHTNRMNNVNVNMQHNQQLSDNDQTAKNNDVSRNVQISEVTGKVPTAFEKNYNEFFNENGELINPDIDYEAIYQERMAAGDTEGARMANVARNYKIQNIPGYEQWANTMRPTTSTDTAKISENKAERQQEKDIINLNADVEKDVYKDKAGTDYYYGKLNREDEYEISEKQKNAELERTLKEAEYKNNLEKSNSSSNSSSNTTKPTLTAAQAISAIKNGEISQSVIDAYNYYYGTNYTTNNPPVLSDSKATYNNVKTALKSRGYITEAADGSINVIKPKEAAEYISDYSGITDDKKTELVKAFKIPDIAVNAAAGGSLYNYIKKSFN